MENYTDIKYKIIHKSYEIDLNQIEDGLFTGEITCYAGNMHEAKSKLWNTIKHTNFRLIDGNELRYSNIPVKRKEEYDLVLFENSETIRHKISDILYKRSKNNEINEILNNDIIKYCYILKGGYYYRNNSCGYTESLLEAGIYEKNDAIKHASCCFDLRLVPIDINKHNEMIRNKIDELTKKIL
jgi:ribosomal protein L2